MSLSIMLQTDKGRAAYIEERTEESEILMLKAQKATKLGQTYRAHRFEMEAQAIDTEILNLKG